MQFSVFSLMGYRDRDTPTYRIVEDTIETVKAAEAAGFEIAWFAEHHFSNYCVCPSPLMMVARLAGETSRIRLGTGVVVAPLYNPIRLLGEIGMVDAFTRGRLVLGLGSGYQPYEFERFGTDLAISAERFVEFVDIYDLAFANETFSYAGKQFELPVTHIAPRPFAKAPPVWIAGEQPAVLEIAARRGAPVLLSPRHISPQLLKTARARVEDRFVSVGANPRELALGTLRIMCVTDDRAEADRFIENIRYQIRLSQALRRREEALDGGMLIEQPWEGEPSLDELAACLLVGDAETIAERMLAEIDAADLKHYLLQFQAGNSPHDLSLRSIERFATDVRPRVMKALEEKAA